MTKSDNTGPTGVKERFVFLDALRGFALLGIALANFPEFGLWTFLSADSQDAIPTADADRLVRFLQYTFVDGKFYTIFSLLFGVGFSLFLSRHSTSRFLLRMFILFGIGLLHLLFLWNGDILSLYAVGGILLVCFLRVSERRLVQIAMLLILLPVALDAAASLLDFDMAAPFYEKWWSVAAEQGINEENFATWLRDAHSYPQMFKFLQQGAWERLWEFAEGHRLPKVLGLFIMGAVIGRRRLYANLSSLRLGHWLRRIVIPSLFLSLLYAYSATQNQPWGHTAHALLYAFSVIPLALCYIMAFALLFERQHQALLFRLLAAPGRMALTNYIGQSLAGISLFYGIGLGLGTSFGLVTIELIALVIFFCQVLLSDLWLRYFRFGPLEWLWRILTYGKIFPIR
ncbi:MAG: DUF418 domain-containing protein [Bacteroidaceae bacterium]|nr:DUF418 domain-containing protein [Bacteroidaceae bacterium]